MRGFSAFGVLFVCSLMLRAQEHSPSRIPAPQEHPPGAPSGISATEVATANNPVANVDSLSFQNVYDPSLFGVPNVLSNTLDMRGVIVSGRQIIRLTLPISTVPIGRSTIDLPGGGLGPKHLASNRASSISFRPRRCEPLRLDRSHRSRRANDACCRSATGRANGD
jgi:hypothetical protein